MMANKNDPHIDSLDSAMEITHIQNISYYNEIAASYDRIMNEQESNAIVRRKVAFRFTQCLPRGRVLDFGGGTGSDLDWLAANYEVLFCEPSVEMRKRAIAHAENKRTHTIQFLEGADTDFTHWSKKRPFDGSVDGILANFAVINCIPDIGLFFEQMAMVLRSGGLLMAVVLKAGIRQSLTSHFNLKPHTLKIKFKDNQQTVFVHKQRAIRKFASTNFIFSGAEWLEGSGFILIKLIRK